MIITPSLFAAFLKCPTKCWLWANSETPSGNTYAEWVQSQNESFRATETERLLADTPPAESARSPSADSLKSGKWRLAVDVVARTPELPRSSRRQEAPSSNAEGGSRNAESDQSLVTSAATAHERGDGLASCAAGVQGRGAFGRGGRDGSGGRSKAVLP